MNIIFSLNNKKASILEENEKFLLFGNNFNKNMSKCSKIYLCNGDNIIGEGDLVEIKDIGHSKLGATNFILFWAKEIKKDEALVKVLEDALNFDLPNYDKSLNLSYMYNLWSLEVLKKTGHLPMLASLSSEEFRLYMENQEKADKVLSECDEWLDDLGFYNDGDESFFKKYIAISNIIVYNKSKELNNFKNKNNESISKAPKNWCYTIN